MPNKNNKNKPNGFVIYANEIRDDLLREGHVIRSLPELLSAASPSWQTLPADEKEYYKDRAKWEWDNRNGSVSQHRQKPARPNRRDCTGRYIDGRVDLVQINEERRKRERTEVFLSFPEGRAVLERNFFIVSFICLLEEPHYQPIEVAAIEFSLLHGVVRDWHKFINPGPIEMGYQYLAQQLSESTHKIPIEGIAAQGDTYTSIYDELVNFLSKGSTLIPPIHVKMSDCDKVEGCIKWLARMAGRPPQLKRIYELEGLLLDLDSHINGQQQDFLASKQTATSLISSTIFDWDSGSKCDFHEENETSFCTRGFVYKYVYLILDYFCNKEGHEIPMTERHKPGKQEKSYTLIKSDKMRAEEAKAKAVCQQRDERVHHSRYGGTSVNDMMNSSDIARRVTEQLNIEAERRQFDEEEMDRREIEEEKARLEEKKRWLSLRPDLNQQSSASSNEPSLALKPVFGRGRGRGTATLQTLRRPGDKPADDPTIDNNNVEKPIRPFGRGTKMYMGN